VRGTNSAVIVKNLLDAGAGEVIFISACPSIVNSCPYGIAIEQKELLSHEYDPKEGLKLEDYLTKKLQDQVIELMKFENPDLSTDREAEIRSKIKLVYGSHDICHEAIYKEEIPPFKIFKLQK
jgi:hypothetical protein